MHRACFKCYDCGAEIYEEPVELFDTCIYYFFTRINSFTRTPSHYDEDYPHPVIMLHALLEFNLKI